MDSTSREDPVDVFTQAIRGWAETLCREKGWSCDRPAFSEAVGKNVPPGLMATIAHSLADKTLAQRDSHKFVLEGARAYSWFSGGLGASGPIVWWEAFIHTTEFLRIKSLAARYEPPLDVRFEDNGMDISVYCDRSLFACYEVKRSREDADSLVAHIEEWGHNGLFETTPAPDKSSVRKDALHKAKYLAFPGGGNERPKYFSVVAIGLRREFSVTFPPSQPDGLARFCLVDDVIPI